MDISVPNLKTTARKIIQILARHKTNRGRPKCITKTPSTVLFSRDKCFPCHGQIQRDILPPCVPFLKTVRRRCLRKAKTSNMKMMMTWIRIMRGRPVGKGLLVHERERNEELRVRCCYPISSQWGVTVSCWMLPRSSIAMYIFLLLSLVFLSWFVHCFFFLFEFNLMKEQPKLYLNRGDWCHHQTFTVRQVSFLLFITNCCIPRYHIGNQLPMIKILKK